MEVQTRFLRERSPTTSQTGEPEVNYTVDEGEGRLTVRQPNADQISLRSGAYNAWDLLLTDALPISLRIQCGAGEQDIDLVGLNITDLDVKRRDRRYDCQCQRHSSAQQDRPGRGRGQRTPRSERCLGRGC